MKIRNYLILKAGEVLFVIIILLLCLSFTARGQVQPSSIFNNGMVLQRGVELPISGTATAGSEVSVSINEISGSAVTEENGKWRVMISAMEAGGPFEMTITSGTATKKYSNVYIGDVWLASGQSNMELTVSNADNAATEMASANNQMIRQFKVTKTTSKEPMDVLPAGCAWTPATSISVGNFSAVGYYFAKSIFSDLNIPIGIINTTSGGARIEAWMSEEMLGYDEEDVVLQGGTYQERQPTLCYNQMLKPLEGFPIKGFIWYQGESNADNMEDALEYGSLFKKMITSWRELWGMGDLPFIWVQLPNQGNISVNPGDWDAWPQLRANQSRALVLPNTGEAVTIDVGDVDIHPKNKVPVGERLALCARKVAYNEDIVYSGPKYKSHSLQSNGKVVIKFEHTGGGLIAKNSTSGEITGFAIAGSNGVLSWANAIISGDSVIVWNNNIPNPAVVRYAWEYNPANINFYNAEGLPAAPFKIYVTDPGFLIKSFSSSINTLERGQTAVLTWESYGASSVTLNDESVDPISGKRIQPQETTTYTLKITSILNPEITTTKTVTVNVIDPLPAISIRTDVGGVTAPGTEITLIADATAPKERTVKQVDFYIDNVLVGTDTESPYEIKWIPSEAGEYSYMAKVTDNTDVSITSAATLIYVTKLKIIYYEAEKATYTGTGSVKSNNQASGKKYLDFASQDWTLTFENVEVSETDEYPLTIRYLLNYESPKAQNLIINGGSPVLVTFTAPNTSTWMSLMQNVSLNTGNNKIEIQTSWGWMSFDYISIAVEDTSTVNEDTSTVSNYILKLNDLQLKSYPNPFRTNSTISYKLPKSGMVKLEVYDITGKKIETLVNNNEPEGNHEIIFTGIEYNSGFYFIKFEFDSIVQTKKMILIK